MSPAHPHRKEASAVFRMIRPLLAMALAAFASTGSALQTERLLDDSIPNFNAGDPTTSTITWNGRVAPPPLRRKIADVDAAVVWDAARVGDDLWLATGHDGRLYVRDKKGRLEEARKFPDSGLYALLARKEELLVATSPSGSIHRINPRSAKKDGNPIQTGERAVWDMLDTPNGLAIATGPKGHLLMADDAGTTRTLLRVPEATNILDLAPIPDSPDLLVATQGNGYVLRVSPDGTYRVLVDPAQEEVRRVGLLPDGSVLAAVNGQRSPGEKFLQTLGEDGKPRANQKPEPVAFILRILADGFVEEWWTSPEAPIHDFQPLADGRVVVAAGNRGRLYEVTADGQTNHLGVSEDEFLVRLVSTGEPGKFLLASGSAAAIYELDLTTLGNGEFNSQIFDARAMGRWVRLTAVVEDAKPGQIAVKWRTGNTGKPDDSWSEWSAPAAINGPGDIALPGPVARYFQYRLEFSTEGLSRREAPALDTMRIFHTLMNQAPRVSEVLVAPPAPKGKPPMPPPTLTGRMQRSSHSALPELEVTWKAMDPNGDVLAFDVYLRARDDGRWTLVEEDVMAPTFTFPANLVPSGEYRARVVARDLPSLTPEVARQGEAISDLFLIDNSQPAVKLLSVVREGDEKVLVHFEASDDFSLVASVAWRAGFEDWQVLQPEDGTMDQRTEKFSITVQGASALPGGFLTVLVTDEAGNTLVSKVPL